MAIRKTRRQVVRDAAAIGAIYAAGWGQPPVPVAAAEALPTATALPAPPADLVQQAAPRDQQRAVGAPYPQGPHPEDTRTYLAALIRDDPYCLSVPAIDAFADTLAARFPERDPLHRGMAHMAMLAYMDGWLAGYDHGYCSGIEEGKDIVRLGLRDVADPSPLAQTLVRLRRLLADTERRSHTATAYERERLVVMLDAAESQCRFMVQCFDGSLLGG